MTEKKKPAPKKERAKKYDKKLKINTSFDEALKIVVGKKILNKARKEISTCYNELVFLFFNK